MKCHKCGAEFEMVAWKQKNWDYRCNKCVYSDKKEYEATRRKEGRFIPNYTPAALLSETELRERNAKSLIANRKWQSKQENRDKISARAKIRRQENPIVKFKHEVRNITRRFIRNGVIAKKPCRICGDQNSQVHHLKYTDPLLVIWLCNKHHKEIHQKTLDRHKKIM